MARTNSTPQAGKATSTGGSQAVVAKVRKAGKAAKKKAALVKQPGGGIAVEGRPDWTTRAKAIAVNQIPSKGDVEDRRHILHWDETLKPMSDRVFTAMRASYPLPADLERALGEPLADLGIKRLPKGADALMLRAVAELNGAVDNLVPDRADINKAIEQVRASLRQYQKSLHTDEFSSAALDGAGANDARMKAYIAAAAGFFPVGRGDTDITSRISEINASVLEAIGGTTSPGNLWGLLNELGNSVTFDLSAKARREQTVKALEWQQRMARNFAQPAADQYRDLLALIA